MIGRRWVPLSLLRSTREDAVAVRRLLERDAARGQVDAIRTALGCNLGEALGTESIVDLLRDAGVTGEKVDALDRLRVRAEAAEQELADLHDQLDAMGEGMACP